MKMNYGSRSLRLGDPDSSVAPVIIDSGSSYTYCKPPTYSDLVASLEEVSGLGLIRDTSDLTLPICWKAESPIRSVKDVKHFFKTLTLQFGSTWWIVSTKLQIPPEGYLIISDKGKVCLGILDGSNVHDGSTIILGDISLCGKLVIYDNVKHKIGWQPSDCNRSQKFELGFGDQIESCLQPSISTIDSNCTWCNTLGIAPDPNPENLNLFGSFGEEGLCS